MTDQQSRTVYDPFLGKNVEVSNRLVDRLRGRYANGPMLPNGEPEFGWRQFETPPIQSVAATEIERLQGIIIAAIPHLERQHAMTNGGPRRSALLGLINEARALKAFAEGASQDRAS